MKNLLACLAILAAFNVSAQVDGFQLPYNPDVEPDGYIGVGDVLELLAMFGQQWNASNIYLNDDSTTMCMDMGQLHIAKCLAVCDALPGSWRLANLTDFGFAMDLIPSIGIPFFIQDENLTIPQVDAVSTKPGISSTIGKMSYGSPGSGYASIYQLDYDDVWQENRCICATHERPKVEYQYCSQCTEANFQPCVDAWLQQGYYPIGSIVNDAGGCLTQAFWRWAD